MIALVHYRIAAYVRSHRVIQAFLPILLLLSFVFASRAPRGQELAALTDSAVLVIPLLAWAARGLLDTEPDTQRTVSATTVGGPGREVTAGLLAALTVTAAFAALALAFGLLLGLSATPTPTTLTAAAALHGLAALTGTTIGALTSRPILPSPAVSIITLLTAFVAMLLLSASPLSWLTVPVTTWMKAAGNDTLTTDLATLTIPSLLWPLLGLAAYTRLRRTRP